MYPFNTNTRHVIFKKMKTARTVASIPITIFFSFSVLSSLSKNSMTFLIILVIFSTGMKSKGYNKIQDSMRVISDLVV